MEAAPPRAGGGDAGGFEVEDEVDYEDWCKVAARNMPPDPAQEGHMEVVVDWHRAPERPAH